MVAPGGLEPRCQTFILVDPEQSDLDKGTQVHRVIREQLAQYFRRAGYGERIPIRLPDASFAPYSNRLGVTPGPGTVDLAYRARSKDVILLAEVKPANFEGLIGGVTQLENYLEKANANDDLKRRLQVTEFRRLDPTGTEPALPTVVWQGRSFEIRWCRPGILFYKEIRSKKKEEEEKKQKKEKDRAEGARRNREAQADDPRSTAVQDRAVTANGLTILTAAPRPWQPRAWIPPELRRAVETGSLRDGVYRDRFTVPYLNGYSSNLVVWVQTSGLGREYQFHREFPTDPAFYADYARRRGLSDWKRDLIKKVLLESNDDMWSLITPEREDRRSIEFARDELRWIYEGILKQVFEVNAKVIGAGAAVNALNTAAQRGASAFQRSTTGRSIGQPQPTTGARPAPKALPSARIENVPENVHLFQGLIQDIRAAAP